MRRLVILLLLASIAVPSQADAAGITVLRNEAVADFPQSLRFQLEAGSDVRITEVLLLFSIGEQETLIEVQPTFEPGTSVVASYKRDTQVYFLPTGVQIHYKWVIRDASGSRHETPMQSLLYEDQRFAWQELKERDVTVRWYAGDAQFGRLLMDAVSRTLDRFEQQFGRALAKPARITIYANAEDMQAALGPNSREWIGGEARPDLGLVIGAIKPDDTAEIKRLVPHELSHIVLHQAAQTPYGASTPFWFDEGLAVINQEEADAFLGDLVTEAAHTGELIPLEALASPFPADYEKALLSYAQSASVVRFIQESYSRDQLAALVDQFGQGATPSQATQAALGVSIDELDAQWRATLPPVTDPAPTATAALHAPPQRFEIETAHGAARTGGGLAGSTAELVSIPIAWLLAGLTLAFALLIIGATLIIRALKR